MARRDDLYPKAEYIAADLSIAQKLFPCSPAADHTLSLLEWIHGRYTCGVPAPNGLSKSVSWLVAGQVFECG